MLWNVSWYSVNVSWKKMEYLDTAMGWKTVASAYKGHAIWNPTEFTYIGLTKIDGEEKPQRVVQ